MSQDDGTRRLVPYHLLPQTRICSFLARSTTGVYGAQTVPPGVCITP